MDTISLSDDMSDNEAQECATFINDFEQCIYFDDSNVDELCFDLIPDGHFIKSAENTDDQSMVEKIRSEAKQLEHMYKQSFYESDDDEQTFDQEEWIPEEMEQYFLNAGKQSQNASKGNEETLDNESEQSYYSDDNIKIERNANLQTNTHGEYETDLSGTMDNGTMERIISTTEPNTGDNININVTSTRQRCKSTLEGFEIDEDAQYIYSKGYTPEITENIIIESVISDEAGYNHSSNSDNDKSGYLEPDVGSRHARLCLNSKPISGIYENRQSLPLSTHSQNISKDAEPPIYHEIIYNDDDSSKIGIGIAEKRTQYKESQGTHNQEGLKKPKKVVSFAESADINATTDNVDASIKTQLPNENQGPPVPPRGSQRFTSKVDKKHEIVDELIRSEQNYLEYLDFMIKNYMGALLEHKCPKIEVDLIFATIIDIYELSSKFLADLQKCDYNYNDIGRAFCRHKKLFSKYPLYSKNKRLASQLITKQYSQIILKEERRFKDRLGLCRALDKPAQRLTEYSLLLNNLNMSIIMAGQESRYISNAIAMVQITAGVSEVLDILETIQKNPLSYKTSGSFVLKENFKLLKPDKMKVVVFLFKKMVIFTEALNDGYVYKTCIPMDQLQINLNYGDVTFALENYNKSKPLIYLLKAANDKVKAVWTTAIHGILFDQLEKRKVEQCNKMSAITPESEELHMERGGDMYDSGLASRSEEQYMRDNYLTQPPKLARRKAPLPPIQ